MNCPICHSSKCTDKYNLYDDRYGYPGVFQLSTCSDCHHGWLKHDFDSCDIRRLYTDYYPRAVISTEHFMPYQEESRIISWLRGTPGRAYYWVPKNVRVLDIGSGFGESIAYHKRRGCEAYGVEADENIKNVIEHYNLNISIGNFNVENYQKDYFDYITLDQVVEHFINPVKTLTEIGSLLKPDGYIVISTPNVRSWGASIFGSKWINWHVPYHLNFFSKKSMRLVADKANLTLNKIYTITPSDWLQYQWFHLLMMPLQGKPSRFWINKNNLTSSEINIRKILNLIHNLKINHIVTRLFDFFGFGDNSLYILSRPPRSKG